MYDITGSVVVYRNPPEQVLKAITSFLNTQLNVRLYVIDNSPDSRIGQLCTDRRVVYVFNGRNLGFGAGHNVAIMASRNEAKYHVVLNPDVYFGSEVLERLLCFARSRPDVGMIMPKVLNPDGSIQHLCKRLPAPADLIIRRFLPRVFRHLAADRLARYEFRDQDYNSLLSVPVLSGCFMMINGTALSQIGVFDERYFMYMEDVDLSRRIHRQFKTVYFPDAAIYHQYAKGSYRSVRLMAHHIVSALLYFHKWGWFSDAERLDMNRALITQNAGRRSVVSGDEPIIRKDFAGGAPR
jgi:GT2 family glycosyltransferase